MSEILQKWLSNRIGVVIDYNLYSFEKVAFDGALVARVLYNYGIINFKNLNRIVKNELEDVNSNWALIKIWLNNIGLNLTEKEIHSIIQMEKPMAAKLFYNLYVILNTKSKVDNFIQIPSESRYNIQVEPSQIYNACKVNVLSKSRIADDIKDVLGYHKCKYKDLIQRCSSAREAYSKLLEDKLKTIEVQKHIKVPQVKHESLTLAKICKKKQPDYPLRKPDISVRLDKDGHCIKDVKKAENYVNYLKKKYDTCSSIKKIHKHLNKMILFELMNNIVDNEDTEFKQIIISKLLKQSNYEKQMATKIISIRQQKEIMLEDVQRENAKINEEKEKKFVEELFQRDKNLTMKEKQFLENRQRQFELHKKLWNKKLEKEHRKVEGICMKIFDDLVDLAMKYSTYRQEVGSVSSNVWHDWGVLFRSEQPIFEQVKDVTQILTTDSSDTDLTLEFYRQNGLDMSDFNDYQEHYGIWEIEAAIEFLSLHKEEIDLGADILGYIVHRLLLMKYPMPEQFKSPTFSQTDIRAAVIGLNNPEIVPLLQDTLTSREIMVVEMHSVVNFCIQAYLEETKTEVDLELEKTKAKVKGGKKEKDMKGEKKSKKGSKKSRDTKEAIVTFEAKETQTPKLFPGQEVVLSEVAQLGKASYEALNLGQQLSEALTILMLAEYMKKFAYLKGFVLINFPQSVFEGYFLEELFNGKKIPSQFKTSLQNLDEELKEEEKEIFSNRDDVFKLPEDEFEDVRLSKFLPNPQPTEATNYDSFFTSVTFLKYKPIPKKSSSHLLLPPKIDHLFEFYKKLSIANELVYEKITFETIKELVYLISKDVVLAAKIFEELEELAISASKKKGKTDKVIDVKPKGGKDKKEKKGKDKRSSRGSSSKRSSASKDSKIPEEEIIDSGPTFVDLPLPKELARILVSTWQDLEHIYISDFKELFFLKRTSQNLIMPYVREVDNNLQNFIERSDTKQEHLHQFQSVFNEIQTDLREDNEFKAELHFRVQEFRNKLYDICDKKMKECEEERRRIIEENWFADHTMNATNIFIRSAQLELDRCVGTLQFLQDYYTSMALQKPLENKLQKAILKKIDLTSSNEKNNYGPTLTRAFLDLKNISEGNPFINYLDSMLATATNMVTGLKTATNPAIKNIESQFGEKEGPIQKSKKSSKKDKKSSKKDTPITPDDINVSKKVTKMITEWRNGIEGEYFRTIYRLYLIHGVGLKTLEENLSHADNLFQEIYSKILERYSDEIESVDTVCQVFSRAIEAGEPIQLRLVLDGTKFSIDDTKLFYPDSAFEYGENKEKMDDYTFSIAQLNILISILMDLAPNGIMTQKLFTYLLEDMLVITSKDSYVCPLPYFWRNLQPDNLPALIELLYFENDFIDWKDFIIWNLLLPYPSEEQIIEVRNQFRDMDPDKLELVNSQQFSTVKFWFDFQDNDYKEDYKVLRNSLSKDLLIRMFQVDNDRINYSGLLLYFCKGEEVTQGFIKALELAVGQLVCWDVSIGERYIIYLRKQKAIEEARAKEALSAANSAIEKVYDRVCAECISTFSFLDVADENVSEQSSSDQNYIFAEEDLEEEHIEEGLPALCYFLKWHVLLKVMSAALPKEVIHTCLKGITLYDRLKEIFCSLQNEEFDNRVFVHDFLKHDDVYDILNCTSKFLAVNPPEVVRDIVEVCTCGKNTQ